MKIPRRDDAIRSCCVSTRAWIEYVPPYQVVDVMRSKVGLCHDYMCDHSEAEHARGRESATSAREAEGKVEEREGKGKSKVEA